MDSHEYAPYVDTGAVVAGIDTAEMLMDWQVVRRMLLERVTASSRIVVAVGHEFVAIEKRGPHDLIVVAQRDDAQAPLRRIHVDMIVNSSWHNIDHVNAMAGLDKGATAVNRVKVIAGVALPPALQQRSSMFFCMGPFAMFSNMIDGRGMVTYAPVTNYRTFLGRDGRKEIDRLLHHGPGAAESAELGRAIVEGVSRFVPAMWEAKVLSVRFGVVRTQGSCDINDPNSDMHRRNYSGVVREADDIITNPATKLIYFARNADAVTSMIDQIFKGRDLSGTSDT